ncbi:AraC family transcriptional regulator [Bacillus altitudinis]|uniref:AraC family transcriptional regulator n=1 Tax=Bacillus altitudinis TaxID=293387 RepID=UPI001F62014C|nr:AraC family transcriptional regulator [Bacillus altitudinis]
MWEQHLDKFEAIKKLHFKHLKTVREISEELEIPEWVILDLFKSQKVDKLSFTELSKRKRAMHFEKLYDMHFNKGMSLKKIHRDFGFSPPYVKKVFEEHGLKHKHFIN